MSNRRQKGQDLIEYQVSAGLGSSHWDVCVYTGRLTNSLKQIYGSVSSVVALLDGNKGSGSNEGRPEEPSVTPADYETKQEINWRIH